MILPIKRPLETATFSLHAGIKCDSFPSTFPPPVAVQRCWLFFERRVPPGASIFGAVRPLCYEDPV